MSEQVNPMRRKVLLATGATALSAPFASRVRASTTGIDMLARYGHGKPRDPVRGLRTSPTVWTPLRPRATTSAPNGFPIVEDRRNEPDRHRPPDAAHRL